jgi:UDP-3-O-[3-hydroxymyristoyl] glucosamine N-acyltransferase
MTAADIATWLQGELVGDGSVDIARVAKIEEARPGDLTFLANPKYERFLSTTSASAVLVSVNLDLQRHQRSSPITFIRVRDPYLAFLHVLKRITPQVDPFPTSIHETAVVAPSAKIGANVALGAHAVVEDDAVVGENTRIGHGCVIGKGAVIGSECSLHSGVKVHHQCVLGSRVTVHAGTVIGSDGFGFAPKPDGTYEKIPQLGRVVIEDDVEIGSNCTIDRATIGETLIRRGAKLDNLIQVAHNVTIGENTVIAAQTGISGSVKIGKNVMIGGQVGIGGHVEIADRAVVLAQSGVTKSLGPEGTIFFGYPAKEQKRAHRMEAALRMLPDLIQEFRELKNKVAALLKQPADTHHS